MYLSSSSESDSDDENNVPPVRLGTGGSVSYEEYHRLLMRVDAMTSKMDLAIENGFHQNQNHAHNGKNSLIYINFFYFTDTSLFIYKV